MVTTRAQAKFRRDGFLLFQRLLTELHFMIWNEAMPRHGIYPVRLTTEEDRNLTTVTYTLIVEPLRPGERTAYPGFPERVRNTRSLLMACQESRARRRFPDAICHRRAEMRFSAKKDLVFTSLARQFPWDDYLPQETLPAVITLAGNWYIVVRRLAIQSRKLLNTLNIFQYLINTDVRQSNARAINTLMNFLSGLVALEQLILVRPGCGSSVHVDRALLIIPRNLRERLGTVYCSGMEVDREPRWTVMSTALFLQPGLLFEGNHRRGPGVGGEGGLPRPARPAEPGRNDVEARVPGASSP